MFELRHEKTYLLCCRPGLTQTGMVRGLKFQIKEVEELYYLSCENKGADQLHGYCKADLRLYFGMCKKQVFS